VPSSTIVLVTEERCIKWDYMDSSSLPILLNTRTGEGVQDVTIRARAGIEFLSTIRPDLICKTSDWIQVIIVKDGLHRKNMTDAMMPILDLGAVVE
jgi:hypothetical protein